MSVATMQRFLQAQPSPGAGRPAKDRPRIRVGPRQRNLAGGHLFGPYVHLLARRAYLQAIPDDKSRKVGPPASSTATTPRLRGTLRMAVASHGIPEKLFVDNGGPYRNDQLSLICGGPGIVLCHAAVRDGLRQGKIERWNRTLRMRFLSTCPSRPRAASTSSTRRWPNG